MKFNYKFSNLLGTVYRGGNVVFTNDGNTLICPVGNKISMYDLANNRSSTLPIEARFNYSALALSPNGNILIASQGDGELHIINLGYRNVLYRKRIHGHVKNIEFSPDGKHFLVSKNKSVFVYNTPSCSRRVYDPFHLERAYENCHDDVLCLDWSFDSRVIIFGSRDMSIHICAFTQFENFNQCQLGGNSESLIGTYFQKDSYDVVTVNKSGQVSIWTCSQKPQDLIEKKELRKISKSDDKKLEDIIASEEEEERGVEGSSNKTPMVVYKRKLKLYLNDYMKTFKSTVSSVSYKKETKVLLTAFTNGNFLLMDLTDSGTLIHSLNISNKTITSTCFNSTGDWIALGASKEGQLLVWEWQSETHILKQQGHFNNMRVVCYSPDNLHIATGGEDGKVKIWSTQTSFCTITFSEHTSPVTGVTFTQSGKAILSSSLDGTVRAFDMMRYRNFKTLTSPTPAQFSCVTVDSSGELVAAGGQDIHEIFLWSLQTGSLLEILGGHTGPVVSVKFSSQLGSTKLVSTAWDKTVKVWDAIATTTAKETITLLAEGSCVAFRNDGEQLAVATMDGQITMFNTSTLTQEANIEGRSDLGAGRGAKDKITAESNLKAKFFTCICYSPDGKFIIGAGQSKNVCIYSIEDALLVKRFQVTKNLSLDGLEKIINIRKMAENGINLNEVERRVRSRKKKIPGCTKGDLSESKFRPQIRVTSLTFSSTGRNWAACTTEGLLIYSLDDDWLFDPLQLEESNTPNSVRRKIQNNNYSTALMMALRLNINTLTQEVIESIPVKSIPVVADSISQLYVELLLKVLPKLLETSKHVGFYSHWGSTLLMKHGQTMKGRAPSLIPELSALQKALTTHLENLTKVCGHNEYMLSYLLCQASLRRQKISAKSEKVANEETLNDSQMKSEEETSEKESESESDNDDDKMS